MLPRDIHRQLFARDQVPNPQLIELSRAHLKQHSLLGSTAKPLKDIAFPLPKLTAEGLDGHFRLLGTEQQQVHARQAQELARTELPPRPAVWQRLEGWTKYNPDGSFEQAIPPGESVVFDIEVLYHLSPYPVFGTAVSGACWYAWVMPGLFDGSVRVPNALIPFGQADTPRLIVGHHVAYDRARIMEEYRLEPTKFGFIDTMSLHCAVGGLSNQQRILWKMHMKGGSDSGDGLSTNSKSMNPMDWKNHGSMNSLQHVAKLYLNMDLDKSTRAEFKQHTVASISKQDVFQELMTYCSKDVEVTHGIFKVLLPKFKEKCPHPVSFAGMLHMSKMYLPTRKSLWDEYISNSEAKFNEIQVAIEKELHRAVEEALEASEKDIECDPWLRHLDWTVKPTKYVPEKKTAKGIIPARPYKSTNMQLIGKPEWYRSLWDNKLKRIRVSPSMKIVPYLLKLSWKGYPLFYNDNHGWIYGAPKSASLKSDSNPSISLSSDDTRFYDPEIEYFRVPHPEGNHNNCGNPLSKSFHQACKSGVLTSKDNVVTRILGLKGMCTYWLSARQRIMSQFVVPSDSVQGSDTNDMNVILPQTVGMGTITRRAVDPLWLTAANAKAGDIGSELKAKIIAPKHYKFVGADVDSQELWISSLIGDSQFGMHGSTAFGFMTLQGTKANGTDLHSRTGQITGITRDQAKVFNYSRIYGAGHRHAQQLILQFNPNISREAATKKVSNLYRETKGLKFKQRGKELWHGGSESFMFNELERIARSDDCRTPFLNCQIPDSLLRKYVQDEFLPSRINWVVQSSGVDYLHLLLVAMDYLMRRMGIRGRFAISIHDEVRFLVHEDDRYMAALILQISNLWIRCLFSSRVGLDDIPLNIAFFSAVDIDDCLRKEVYLDCVTPSNPKPIPPGESLGIEDILVKAFGPRLGMDMDTADYDQLVTKLNAIGDAELELYGKELQSIQKMQLTNVFGQEKQKQRWPDKNFLRAQGSSDPRLVANLLRYV